jgi:SWI/SNF-related matrix-associated actin-dependent regulator of chromatin subfamily A member 5
MTLVRRGVQTLTHPEVDINEMLKWDWETTLLKCSRSDAAPPIKEEDASMTAEEQEQRWLARMERVEAYVLDGKKIAKDTARLSKAVVPLDLPREARRVGKNTTVMIDGFAVSKESTRCAQWEAVPTLAGKDLRLAEPKRTRQRVLVHQDVSKMMAHGSKTIRFFPSITLPSGDPYADKKE